MPRYQKKRQMKTTSSLVDKDIKKREKNSNIEMYKGVKKGLQGFTLFILSGCGGWLYA